MSKAAPEGGEIYSILNYYILSSASSKKAPFFIKKAPFLCPKQLAIVSTY
jgi:hypothetical protein